MEAGAETPSRKPIVIIEKVKPLDGHDAKKRIKLRGRVEGSDEESWLTKTIDVAMLVDKPDPKAEFERIESQFADQVLEYHKRYLVVKSL